MNFMSRLFNGLFALTLLLLATVNLPVEWFLRMCPLPNRYGEYTSLLQTQRITERMANVARLSIERLHRKEMAADALSRGNISLLEAAVCFRALHEDPKSWSNPFRPRPAFRDGEGWCREVIRWTETRTRFVQSSYEADALRDRLEAELQEQLEHCGGVTLPG